MKFIVIYMVIAVICVQLPALQGNLLLLPPQQNMLMRESALSSVCACVFASGEENSIVLVMFFGKKS